jgi:DnaJ-class molecular chaperone
MRREDFQDWLSDGMKDRPEDPDPIYPLPEVITEAHGIKRFELAGTRATLGCDLALGRGIGCAWQREGVTVDIDFNGCKARIHLERFNPTWKPGLRDEDGYEVRAPTPADEECYVGEGVLKSITTSDGEGECTGCGGTGHTKEGRYCERCGETGTEKPWPCEYCGGKGYTDEDCHEGEAKSCRECSGHGWARTCRACEGSGCEDCEGTGQEGVAVTERFKGVDIEAMKTATMKDSARRTHGLVSCPECDGTGKRRGHECERCGGHGEVPKDEIALEGGPRPRSVDCPDCEGEGSHGKGRTRRKCGLCGGSGRVDALVGATRRKKCPVCFGDGRGEDGKPCPGCEGTGDAWKGVKIERGAEHVTVKVRADKDAEHVKIIPSLEDGFEERRCEVCTGRGIVSGHKCGSCAGSGKVMMPKDDPGPGREPKCPTCKGSGKAPLGTTCGPKGSCKVCGGSGTVTRRYLDGVRARDAAARKARAKKAKAKGAPKAKAKPRPEGAAPEAWAERTAETAMRLMGVMKAMSGEADVDVVLKGVDPEAVAKLKRALKPKGG